MEKHTVECGFRPPRTKEQGPVPDEPDCGFKKTAKVPPPQGEEPAAAAAEESETDASPVRSGKRK